MAQKRSKKPSGGKKAAARCGLCGKSKSLVRTECCDNLICDDESSYRMFSYDTNSCHRNHRRYTLCGYHHTEEHAGSWKDCQLCRGEFETELFVHFGTNDFNFERLQNPPKFDPTLCSQCGSRIALGDASYSQRGDKYWCSGCTEKRMRR